MQSSLAVPWESQFSALRLSFPICEVATITSPYSHCSGINEIEGVLSVHSTSHPVSTMWPVMVAVDRAASSSDGSHILETRKQ